MLDEALGCQSEKLSKVCEDDKHEEPRDNSPTRVTLFRGPGLQGTDSDGGGDHVVEEDGGGIGVVKAGQNLPQRHPDSRVGHVCVVRVCHGEDCGRVDAPAIPLTVDPEMGRVGIFVDVCLESGKNGQSLELPRSDGMPPRRPQGPRSRLVRAIR